jgi:DNA processing protein
MGETSKNPAKQFDKSRHDNLLQWFTLKSVSGIGNHLFKRLIQHFNSPDSVLNASTEELLQVEGLTPRLATAIKKQRPTDVMRVEIDRAAQKGFRVVTMADAAYPPLLREIPDPPPFIYVAGRLRQMQRTISVVGSRNATDYGLATTRRLCRHLAEKKLTVVSGMARGIDTAAHQGALSGGGITIAVLGSGLERIYPSENRKLFRQISETGAVISEFSLNAEPDAHHFPIRNRIISGVSLGTVIVEATKKSGSLITARLAAEQNREVFAVPGNIHSFKSVGTHSLIKQGAKLVEHAQDILEELRLEILEDITRKKAKETVLLSDQEKRVFSALDAEPIHIDDLVRKVGMEPGKLSSVLLTLELKGLVEQASGKRFFLTNEIP